MSHDDVLAAQLEVLRQMYAGKWSFERELGRGGMATVYLGRDVALERPVAIKVLSPELALDPEERARFVREARLGARLTHPSIVPIFSVEELGGTVCIVMGLVDGETLADRIHRSGPMSSEHVLRMLREIGQGVGYAHAMGTLHRDITLQNILFDQRTGRAMLVDFGIAAEIDGKGPALVHGTPEYLAPEVIQGEAPSRGSDIYALGVCAWAALAGRLPFHGEDSASVLLQHLTAPLPSLLGAAPQASATLAEAIESSLAKNPSDRPETMESWLEGLTSKAAMVTPSGPLQEWVAFWPQVRAFYLIAICLGIFLVQMGLGSGLGMLFTGLRRTMPRQIMMAFWVLAPVMVVHFGMAFRSLRKTRRAGYRLEDLRVAVGARALPARLDPARISSRVRKIVNRVAWASGIGFLAFAILFSEPWLTRDMVINKIPVPPILDILTHLVRPFFLVLVGSIAVLAMTSKGEGPLMQWLRVKRAAFWNSQFGRGYFALAGVGTRSSSTPEATLHRPTELMLDLAIEDLWQALPASHQQRLKELPVLARSLRQRVAKLREIQEQVDTTGVHHTSEIRAIKQELSNRQAAGVTALERLRLLLMKLGSAALTEEELTGPLALARGTDEELLATLGAHRDLYRRLRQPTASATPHPTPA